MRNRPPSKALCSLAASFVLFCPGSLAQVAAPDFTAAPVRNGAVILTLKDSTAGSTIHYTVDGSEPTASSPQYFAPLLIFAKDGVVKASAVAGGKASGTAVYALHASVPSGALVWSDEFANLSGSMAKPDPKIWAYDEGNQDGFGNHELENYCAWGSEAKPCRAASPNAYVGTDGYLHVVARKLPDGTYTSARLKTQGLFSVQYGRIEARMRLPQGQGLWPAFWLLGDNITTVDWPACGEQDVMEHINGPGRKAKPDWIEGSVHGIGFVGDDGLGKKIYLPAGKTTAEWHTYGMIWSKGSVSYYVDDPAKPYVTYTPASLDEMKRKGIKTTVWPFDNGQSNFIILNLAVGGDWPKSPDQTTSFPAEMLVDYVRIYAE